MKKMLAISVFMFLVYSCNNSDNNSGVSDSKSDSKKVKTHSDTLMDEVMEGHNVGMAKMSKLSEAQKKIQQAIDSISKLSPGLQKSSQAHRIQLDSVLNRLKYADYAMNRWMEEFNMDSAADNEEMRIKYLESEKIKITKVKDTMISSLQKADSLLNHLK